VRRGEQGLRPHGADHDGHRADGQVGLAFPERTQPYLPLSSRYGGLAAALRRSSQMAGRSATMATAGAWGQWWWTDRGYPFSALLSCALSLSSISRFPFSLVKHA
jgi:hypothetical protein